MSEIESSPFSAEGDEASYDSYEVINWADAAVRAYGSFRTSEGVDYYSADWDHPVTADHVHLEKKSIGTVDYYYMSIRAEFDTEANLLLQFNSELDGAEECDSEGEVYPEQDDIWENESVALWYLRGSCASYYLQRDRQEIIDEFAAVIGARFATAGVLRQAIEERLMDVN